MTTVKHEAVSGVVDAIEDAAQAACRVLDSHFPGFEQCGITSNFQGLLMDVIGHMLKGRSVLDGKRGHATQLPQLVIDNSFFGDPIVRGEMFLVTKVGDDGRVVALSPDSLVFRSLDRIGDAWTSFDAAAAFALNYLRAEGISIAEAAELGLTVQSVQFDGDRERGFVIVGQAEKLAA